MNLDQAVSEFCRGDRQAFDHIHDSYKRPLWAFLCTRADNFDDAEELFSMVSLRIVRDLPQLRETKKLVSWVLSIAAHSLSAFYRKRVKPHENLEDIANNFWDQRPFGENRLIQRERVTQLRRCIQTLSGPQRKYFEFQYLAGRSQKKIAEDEGLNLNVLKSYVFRAKTKLLKCMRQYGYFAGADPKESAATANSLPEKRLERESRT